MSNFISTNEVVKCDLKAVTPPICGKTVLRDASPVINQSSRADSLRIGCQWYWFRDWSSYSIHIQSNLGITNFKGPREKFVITRVRYTEVHRKVIIYSKTNTRKWSFTVKPMICMYVQWHHIMYHILIRIRKLHYVVFSSLSLFMYF